MTEQRPSGAQMLERTVKVKNRVAHILKMFPQTKGDDLQLIYRYYRLYTPVRLTFSDFKQLLMCPTPETIRRRRQELQQLEKEAVEAGELDIRDCQYLPRERTLKKRHDYREALRHYHGNGQLTVSDFTVEA